MSTRAFKLLQRVSLLFATALALSVSTLIAHAAQSDVQAELDSYIEVFDKGSFSEQRKQMNRLEWSGISDPALFDLIAAKLATRAELNSKAAKEEASWYAKALALSGNEKYRTQLQAIATAAKARKVRKHAETALRRLDLYATWNPIISNEVEQAPIGQLAEARVKNMLATDNPHVLRLGAKRLHHAHTDNKELLQLASQRLLRDYQGSDDDGIKIDALAWLIKALAKSDELQYRQTLEQIAETSSNKKLKKFAKKYLGTYTG